MNYNEALEYIHSLQVFGSIPGLERITLLLDKLGNPQKDLKFIHVAGTNGKGSTCTMLAKIYEKAGLNVGLYTSPFIVDFRERIQINGEYIPKEDLSRLCKIVKETEIYVTEFEFITALAFLYYKEQNCDIVILEVGLGGRFDATNVIDAPLCAVITRIDLDHTDYLGDTYSKIASEKCGIIKDNCPVTVYPDEPLEALDTIKSFSKDCTVPNRTDIKVLNSDVSGNKFIYKDKEFTTRLVGKHQIYNAVLAIETARKVGMVTEDNISDGIDEAVIPARVELISSSPDVVLDGSHNPNGADALTGFMKNYDNDIVAIIGMMADKDCEQFLCKVAPYCSVVITVTVKENSRSISAEDLSKLAKKHIQNVIVAETYDQAISFAKEKSDGKKPIFVCGSLYLASAIREKLKNTFK